ncbi:MAG: S-layer homology domain-containing protein, partial [Oscillospiraceae bacterium]|nr:S-layer homology domain-containing protein [Oscillospiraceae bacterium]
NDYLTREEAATIIIRMINKVMPMPATEMWFEYDDIDEISEWASDSIQTISNLGFMNGVGNNKFAPKDTYTTEQAIATLVRVYEGAEAAGIINHSASGIAVVGSAGANVPPQIAVTDTIGIDDFYIDEAIKLVVESGKLAADQEFIGYYTSDEETLANILELGGADYSRPATIYYMGADKEQIIANVKALYGGELDGFDIEKLLQLKRVNFSILPNMINASYGVKNLAALTILTNSRGYIMPKDFTKDFALYLEYDEGCSALISFSEYGDGVISANMSFVINGYKDNIFSRLYEITQALGEDSIYVAKVK